MKGEENEEKFEKKNIFPFERFMASKNTLQLQLSGFL